MLVLIYLFLVYTAIPQTDGTVQNFYWRDYLAGDIPCDAYQGAPGLYIGQVNIEGHNLPATIYTHINTAVAELGGERAVKEDIKILCSPDNNRFYWEYVDLDKKENQWFQNAVKGGFETNNHLQLFIGKISHDEEWQIGKVHNIPENKINKGIWVWNPDHTSFASNQFFLLKYNRTNDCHQQCHFLL